MRARCRTRPSRRSSRSALAGAASTGRRAHAPFRGKADRVDRADDGSLLVLDYKTGKRSPYKGLSAENPDHGGTLLQLPVYGAAARLHQHTPDAPVQARVLVRVEAWRLRSRGLRGHPTWCSNVSARPSADRVRHRGGHVRVPPDADRAPRSSTSARPATPTTWRQRAAHRVGAQARRRRARAVLEVRGAVRTTTAATMAEERRAGASATETTSRSPIRRRATASSRTSTRRCSSRRARARARPGPRRARDRARRDGNGRAARDRGDHVHREGGRRAARPAAPRAPGTRRTGRRTPTTPRRFRDALDQLDSAAIGTLHSFAQRILSENPIEAGLPPRVEVLDEVSSGVEFERRWGTFQDRLFEDPALARSLLLLDAADVRPSALRRARGRVRRQLGPRRRPRSRVGAPAARRARRARAGPARARPVCDERHGCTDATDKLFARLGKLAGELADVHGPLAQADEFDVVERISSGELKVARNDRPEGELARRQRGARSTQARGSRHSTVRRSRSATPRCGRSRARFDASRSTPPPNGAPRGGWSSTTCSCSPARCSAIRTTAPTCGNVCTARYQRAPARRVPGHRPDPDRAGGAHRGRRSREQRRGHASVGRVAVDARATSSSSATRSSRSTGSAAPTSPRSSRRATASRRRRRGGRS